MNTFHSLCLATTISLIAMAHSPSQDTPKDMQKDKLSWGVSSLSLAVKDIKVSRAFYEKLDFHEVAGDMKQNWIVLQNGGTTIGLFQGMFEANLLTFNPGWDLNKKTLPDFIDVRELQETLKSRGIQPTVEAATEGSGPAHFMLVDPDGNAILVDQHVDAPE